MMEMSLWSAYQGVINRVDFGLEKSTDGTIKLENTVPGQLPILIRIFDAMHLTDTEVDTLMQRDDWDETLTVVVVSMECTRRNYLVILEDSGKFGTADKRAAIRYNAAVDAYVNAYQFVRFIQDVIGVHTISHRSSITVLYGVRGKIGASYYQRECVVSIGIGDDYHLPAASTDIMGHELGHGLQLHRDPLHGEYGALCEHFSDVCGASFESYTNAKRSQASALPVNWTIGEDMFETGSIRDMKDPERTGEPAWYKGRFWVDTTNTRDQGGIHTNCSVGNHFFYLFTQQVGMSISTQVLFDVMYRMPQSYQQYALELLSIAESYNVRSQCLQCLQRCGLSRQKRQCIPGCVIS